MTFPAMHANSPRSARVLGLRLSLLTMEETISVLEARIQESAPGYVVTVNATALVLAHECPEYRALLEKAALLTVDGAGVQWALKRQGIPSVPKVAGIELVERLVERSADRGYRVFFLGGEPGVAELAAERMRLRCPGCNVVGARHGYFPASDDDVVAREVAEIRPDVLVVGLGMPRQERFIDQNMEIIGAKVAIGAGGSFDVLSGRVKRAPAIWQRLRVEWLWRAIQNPSKFAKLWALPRFAILVLREGK